MPGMQTQGDMKQNHPSDAVEMDIHKKSGILFFILSFAIHAVVFAAMVYFQDFTIPKPMPPVIQVDLVSFSPDLLPGSPDSDAASSDEKGAAPEAKPIKQTPEKIKHIKADISLKTKPKNIKELMEKQQQKEKKPEEKKEKEPVQKPEKAPEKIADTQKELEKARQDLEKKIEDQNKERIAEALRRLQSSVKEGQGKEKQGQTENPFAEKGQKGYKPIDLYKLVLGSTIKQNWVYTDILAGMDKNLEVRILIKILKSGEIRDIIYETKSGNRYLDESAKKTIKKSNPLPPLPAGMASFDVVVIFTPQGLK